MKTSNILVLTAAILLILVALTTLGVIIATLAYDEGYRDGYNDSKNSMMHVDYLSGESVDSIKFVSLNTK